MTCSARRAFPGTDVIILISSGRKSVTNIHTFPLFLHEEGPAIVRRMLGSHAMCDLRVEQPLPEARNRGVQRQRILEGHSDPGKNSRRLTNHQGSLA